jgi:hypothetical protein
MIEFKDILERIKSELILKNDREVADIMGVKTQNVTNWKIRNTIPFLEIISLCLEKDINLIYILTGKKKEKININDKNLKKNEEEIIKKLKKLNPIQQKIIINKIEGEIMKNEEKEIELLKESILKNYENRTSTKKVIIEEFERDEEIYKCVYISDDWDTDLERETYYESNKKEYKELLEELLKNSKKESKK